MLQEKRAGKNSDEINQNLVAIIDELLEYKCMTPTQHKKIFRNFHLIGKMFTNTCFFSY